MEITTSIVAKAVIDGKEMEERGHDNFFLNQQKTKP